jgi:hypothetical protein
MDMLDVHPPHRPIEGVGEFFLHLFTISVGLLIAVGIEAAVERHQHRELAAEARDTMTAEIRKNSRDVADALKDIDREQQKLKHNLAEVRNVQLNPKASSSQSPSLDISFNTTRPRGYRMENSAGYWRFGIHALRGVRKIHQYLPRGGGIFEE